MRSRDWLVLGMLMFPATATAQMVKEADLVGGWMAELEHSDDPGGNFGTRGWLLLWPDGLWAYGGDLMVHSHGGARWRLVGDTLWLGNDYEPYYHPMIALRIRSDHLTRAITDTSVINKRPPYPVPDSVYWSKSFRDSVTSCATKTICGTWVYKVSKKGEQLHLVRLDNLSRATGSVATKAVLTRDSLVNCGWTGCP